MTQQQYDILDRLISGNFNHTVTVKNTLNSFIIKITKDLEDIKTQNSTIIHNQKILGDRLKEFMQNK
jgi:hypothetical protein